MIGAAAYWIAAAVVVACTAVMVFYRPDTAGINSDDMSPANLDSFSITSASEGSCVAKVYGRVRLSGNILWYGNLVSEEVYQEVDTGGKGGGGGGSEDVLQGYNYYIDMWQGVCCGPASLVKVYINDTETDLSSRCTSYDWNDGTDATFPDAPGEYASSLPGIAHVFIEKFFIGFNASSVPTLHFVVNSDPADVPLSDVAFDNGTNPAAIIYDVLNMAGATATQIDTDSFNAAGTYWKVCGYGLNMSITSKKTASAIIEQVLGYVGGSFYERTDGTYSVKANDPSELSAATITDETDCTELTIKRKTWDDTYNDFSAKYQSADLSETTRVVVAQNPASIALMGRTVSQSVDLTGFRDQDSASRRVWEIMKRESYPSAEMECTCFLKHAKRSVGDIVKITSARYGVTDMEFRITTKDVSEIDENTVTFQGLQVIERLYSSSFTPPSTGPAWVPSDNTPLSVDQALKILELPKNPYSGTEPALLLLAARQGQEDGMYVYKSNDGADYYYFSKILTWAQLGTLVDEYTADTLAIDDDIGLLYSTDREDPVFPSYSRTDLFARPRVAIVDDEIMGFQIVQLEGVADLRLTGVVRGLFGTPIQTHAAGATIWLTSINDSLQLLGDVTEVWLKILPTFNGEAVELDSVAAHHITVSNTAAIPWPVAGLRAVRDGSTVTVSWMPRDVGLGGAGLSSADTQTDQYPYAYAGDFVVNGTTVAGTETTLTTASQVTAMVYARQDGRLSESRSIIVPTEDGTYYA